MNALDLYDEICDVCTGFIPEPNDYKYKIPKQSKHYLRIHSTIIADVSMNLITGWDSDQVMSIEIGNGKKKGVYRVAESGLSCAQLKRVCKSIVKRNEQEKDRKDKSRHHTRMLMRAEEMVGALNGSTLRKLQDKLGLRLYAKVDRDGEAYIEARLNHVEYFSNVDDADEWMVNL